MYASDCACSERGTNRTQVCLSHLFIATFISALDISSVTMYNRKQVQQIKDILDILYITKTFLSITHVTKKLNKICDNAGGKA